MSAKVRPDPQGTGSAYSPQAMLLARDRTFEAVNRIAAGITPGMTEAAAHDLADRILASMGMDKLWHKTVIRFGAGTLKTFRDAPDPDVVLQRDDIFFVDLGVVWNGHEGDAGDTFVVGRDPEMLACAEAARELWADVAQRWRAEGLNGTALYEYAGKEATRRGWRLNHSVKGHRVSDFPHAIHKAGPLGDFGGAPAPGLWILEIQLAHPKRAIGAFFEDILVGPVASGATIAKEPSA